MTLKPSFILLLFFALLSPNYAVDDEKPNPNLKDLIIVFKMHFDIGYTHLAESVLQDYATNMIIRTLSSMEESKAQPKENQFVWTVPGWPMKYILEHAAANDQAKIDEALRQGWFSVHALPFTYETEASDLESLVRGLNFSSTLARRFARPLPRGAKLTDVPSHSWILPTILTHAGIDILHLGCNPASASPEVPLLFWWEGPDSSRLLTLYWGKYYGTSLIPPEGWNHSSWLAIIHTHENTGAPTHAEVEETLAKAHRLAPNAKIRIGEISDFYDALMKENPQIPVVRGDMPDTWIHGYLSMPRELKLNKSLQKTIFILEALNSLCDLWGVEPADVSKYVDEAIENSILFDEHTFGMAMSHGQNAGWAYGEAFAQERGKGGYDLIEASWREKGERVHRAERVILPALERQLKSLARSVAVKGARILVYNPLPWPRTGVVSSYLGIYKKGEDFTAVQDVATGEIITVWNRKNYLSFAAKNVPAMGYRTYIPMTSEVKGVAKISIDKNIPALENSYFKLQLSAKTGSILSLFDKKNKRQIVKRGAGFNFAQYFHERFSRAEINRYNEEYIKNGQANSWAYDEMGRPFLPDSSYQIWQATDPKIELSQNAFSSEAVVVYPRGKGLPYRYTLTYRLLEPLPYLEIDWAIENKPADPWPEAGWMAFTLDIPDPDFHLGRIGAVVDPKRDFIKGTNLDYGFINTGLAVVDKNGVGIGISSPDAPGVSLDRPGLFRHSRAFIPQQANVFINLFNNQWGTNFTEWIDGSWFARLFLWSIDRYDAERSLITPAEELRVPLLAAYVEEKAGILPVISTGISVSERGVLITAFGPNPDGQGTILRLWEQAGKSHQCTITLPKGAPFAWAHRCTLRGEKIDSPMTLNNNSFTISIKPYQPLSFILQ